jgi:hypothetical protein
MSLILNELYILCAKLLTSLLHSFSISASLLNVIVLFLQKSEEKSEKLESFYFDFRNKEDYINSTLLNLHVNGCAVV